MHWALDSGGFTELSTHGRWTVSPERYVADVRGWQAKHGRLMWAAVQDWMCEPWITEKTGFTVLEHQMFTIQSWLRLNDLAPEIPWVPVLQGWEHGDYLNHYWLYQRYAGVDLATLPLVGVGSVCRREDTAMAEDLIRELHGMGIRVHGFGFKIDGLARCAKYMTSADSLAWSYAARRRKRPMIHGHGHRTCTNCFDWAMLWRKKVLKAVDRGFDRARQLTLF